MLKRENRISLNKDFDRVFKAGQSFYSPFLGIKRGVNALGVNRLGILISTKVSKKAVIRNKFKRRIREIVQKEMLKLKPGNDLVFVVFSQILDKNFKEITETIKFGFNKLKLYK